MGTLSEKFSTWKEERQLTQSEHVCIVPADLCFMSTCPLPEGKVIPNVIENIALLSLESTSPFPINDIFWGYFVDVNTSTIYIFSALKNRIKTIDAEVEFAAYVLPDFILPIIHSSMSKAILKHRNTLTIFEKNATSGINFTPTSSLNEEETSSLPIFELLEIIPIREFGVTIRFAQSENFRSSPLERSRDFSFTNPLISAANMQNTELKKIKKQSKISTNRALCITVMAAVIAFVGVCGLFELRYLSLCENKFTKELASQNNYVKQIQQKEDRTHELDLFSNKKHAYFRGLNKINELRPDSILFKKVYASEGERFEIKCAAPTLAILEKFKKDLDESSLFRVVRIEDKSIQDNQCINFSLFLTFEKL